MDFPPLQLALLVACIAFLYASVGFGGASGYLAAMSMFALPPMIMASTALGLNILVSTISFTAYHQARHFIPRLLWPFLLTSVPAAFLGGYLKIPVEAYLVLLYLSLTYVAARMLFYRTPKDLSREALVSFSIPVALVAGGLIGLLSGLVGTGGGIFLFPLIVVARWGTPKQAAASAAGFIFVNSVSGLVGRAAGGNLVFGTLGVALLPFGLLGALGGSWLGARYLSGTGLRRALGVVLFIAVARFWVGFLG